MSSELKPIGRARTGAAGVATTLYRPPPSTGSTRAPRARHPLPPGTPRWYPRACQRIAARRTCGCRISAGTVTRCSAVRFAILGFGFRVQVADPRRIVPALRTQGARQLVVPVRLGVAPLLLQCPPEPVVGVMVGGRQLEHGAKLLLRLLVALDSEIGDAERLADRRLVRLTPLRLLERDGRLRGAALAKVGASLLKEVVGLAHLPVR